MQQTPLQIPVPAPEDSRDCLQCLIDMNGDTYIDMPAPLLNLTAYAESRFSRLCTRRLRR